MYNLYCLGYLNFTIIIIYTPNIYKSFNVHLWQSMTNKIFQEIMFTFYVHLTETAKGIKNIIIPYDRTCVCATVRKIRVRGCYLFHTGFYFDVNLIFARLTHMIGPFLFSFPHLVEVHSGKYKVIPCAKNTSHCLLICITLSYNVKNIYITL